MPYKVHIINGPNLNLLGKREIKIYGNQSFESYFKLLQNEFKEIELFYFQSNHEGAIIDYLQEIGYNDGTGIVLNPAAYTHTSIAIADCVAAITTPVFEVHISDISKREKFRHLSYLRPYVVGHIQGEGLDGYHHAIERIIKLI